MLVRIGCPLSQLAHGYLLPKLAWDLRRGDQRQDELADDKVGDVALVQARRYLPDISQQST